MKISLIVPCYNEEDVLEMFYTETIKVMNENVLNYELIFINDGSKDKTKDLIVDLSKKNDRVKYISFSRNFGKESAMLAGLKFATGEYIGILDADLQHPPSLVLEMIKALETGYDVAAARRIDREGEHKFKSYLSSKFYSIMDKLADIELQQGAQDFRLMKRKVVQSILSMPEYNRFSKGIFSWVGFKTKWIEHENVKRPVGDSKWKLSSLFKYAIDGIVAFSVIPLKISLVVGVIASMAGFIYALQIVISMLLIGGERSGYASLMSGMLIIGGVILICLGVLGEYVSKIYMEVKRRPHFIVDETNIVLNLDNEEEK